MIPFSHRFHGHGSLRYVYKNGTAIRSRLVTLKYTQNKRRNTSRVAVVISKKVLKTAVGRNRIRRRIYEIVRHELPRIKQPHDIVLMVFSSEVRALPHEDLKQVIVDLFRQAHLYDD